jgi:hypothetical protein
MKGLKGMAAEFQPDRGFRAARGGLPAQPIGRTRPAQGIEYLRTVQSTGGLEE